MYDLDQLKTVVEALADPATLDGHPLTTAPFVDHYRQHHPEILALSAGEVLGRVLAETWRQQCLPSTLNARLRREWNLFLALEAGYFFPFRHRRRFPGGLAQLGALLVDRDHVALVIADGDERRAQTLRHSDYAEFWEMLAPTNKKETLALGITTMAARRDTALRRLAQELKRIETQPSATEAPSRVNPKASSEPSDTLALYRDHLTSAAPNWMPNEWNALLDLVHTTKRFSIIGIAGSGKTEVMRAITKRVGQTDLIPLYLPVGEYTRHAEQLDVVQFVARRSGFGLLYREENLQQDLEKRLAEAQRSDRLILLADQVDELAEAELPEVSRRLQLFPRLIVAERTSRLAALCGIACHQPLSDLSQPSATTFLQSHGYDSETAQRCITQFQQWNIPLQTGLLSQVIQGVPNGHWHPASVVQQWINQQLTATRPSGKMMAEAEQARHLLRYLAGVRYDIAPHPEASIDLTRENVRRAFWSLALTPDQEEQGWHLIEFCCRAGIIQPVQSRWEFTQSAIERALAAEFISEETHWVSLHPHQRDLMRWTAALIARQATDRRQLIFIQDLRRALSNATRLSAIEVADVLAESMINETVEAQTFKAEVIEQLEGLKQLGLLRLANTAQNKIDHLNGASHYSAASASGLSLIPSAQYQPPVHTLSEVLSELGLSVPAGTEDRWLEDRRVLSGLIDGLCQAASPDLKQQCAAWLYRAPLSKVVELHVPEQRWWKSRTRSALEVLAQRALEPESDELTRRWLYTILAREERVLQLWQRGDEYLPLVYDLLLALDQRLFLVTGLLTQPEWHLMS